MARLTKQERERRAKLAGLGSKVCTKCNEEKFFSDFHKDKGKIDGLSSHCKACVKTRERRRWSEATKEKEELFSKGLKRCSSCKEVINLIH